MSYKDISVDEFKEKMGNPDTVVLDVRTPSELSEGEVPGYQMIDVSDPDFLKKIAELNKNKIYLVYCRSGNRSAYACQIMEKMGFKNLYSLTGGIKAWNEQSA